MVTRRELRYELGELKHRVKELEQLLCPAEQHNYYEVEEYPNGAVRCVCMRCLKEVVKYDHLDR